MTFGALAIPSRRRLLDELRVAGRALDLKELAAASGLHPNTVRFHLAVLVQAGFVVAGPGQPRGRGRPQTVYRSVVPAIPASGYQFLSELLAAEIDRQGVDDLAEAAGRSWLRSTTVSPPADGADPLAAATTRVVALFTELGFEPVVTAEEPAASRIELPTCPFITVAREHPDVVCGLHRGLLRAAAEAVGPSSTTELVPFARPGVCLAHIRRSEGTTPS